MSKHIPRSARWERRHPAEYVSGEGLVVRFFKGAWWADLTYRILPEPAEGGPVAWEPREERLGPYKRPRNAMVEAERHVTMLRNRLGDRLAMGH